MRVADVPKGVRLPFTTDPPTEADILREIRDERHYKAPGFDDLSLVVFNDGKMELVRELQVLFSKVWHSD